MLNLKLQNMKEAAYFDYFKSFSLNASDTIKKLETEFKEQIEESFFFDQAMMFKRVKTLLGSYEILIYEINDSCEFVEIPEFGNCILKIFLQIMSVIRFLLHKILQKSSKKQDPSPFVDRTNSIQKSSMNMTHTHFPNTASHHDQNRVMYRKKEQSKYIINNLKQELSLLEIEQSENLQASKKQLRSIIQGKEKLQSIQISQNQNILSEALNSFCKKGEHLKTFVNVRQAAMISNMKEGVGEYLKVKDILDEDSNAKLSTASVKLQELFKTHTTNYLREKQSEMISQQVQVHIEESLQNRILEENKHIKKLNEIVKKLKDEIEFQQQKAHSLENLLRTKNQEFQLKAMEFRVAKLDMESTKIKNEKILEAELSQINNSKHDLCFNCQNKISSSPQQKKSEIDCVSKSIIESPETNELVISEETDRNEGSVVQNVSRLMQKMNKRANFKTSSSLTRKNLAYKQTTSKSDELDIYSLTWFLRIEPQALPQPTRQTSTKKRTIVQKEPANSTNSMNNTLNSFRDNNKRVKSRIVTIESKNSLEIQRVFTFDWNQFRAFESTDNNNEPRLFGVKGLKKKSTEGSISGNQGMIRKMSENQFSQDQVDQLNRDGCLQQDSSKFDTFRRNDIQTEFDSGQNNENNVDEPQKDSQTTKNQRSSHKTRISKSSKNLNRKKQNLHTLNDQDELVNSASRLSVNPYSNKFPKFIKFSAQQKITLTFKDLCNLFFDIETAKNFEYINLFQNDDLRVGTAVQEKRKTNQALTANIKQLQKKNFINGLIAKVKGEVFSKNMNLSTVQLFDISRVNKQNVTIECPSMKGALSGTLMKTQFRNQITVQKNSQHQNENEQVVRFYDSQNLVAMLFKQLRDLKRLVTPNSLQMTNYETVRNFLRYPFSTISLKTDKTFLEKQRQESGMEYLELRKIMQRVFKLHKNCKSHQKQSDYEKVRVNQITNNQQNFLDDNENVLCSHVSDFFETVGIVLLPKPINTESQSG